MQVSLEITQEGYDALQAVINNINAEIENVNMLNADNEDFIPNELLTSETYLASRVNDVLDSYISQTVTRKREVLVDRIKQLPPDKLAEVEQILTSKSK